MKIDLMLHDDWEIYGDGSGDLHTLMFDPAKKILDACDEAGAKYTFFAEVGQQFAMMESSDPVHQNDAREWERILMDAVKRGHDVQLHLHPQWIGARFQNKKWNVDTSKWSTAKLDRTELLAWLKRGVEYFNALFAPIDKTYRVVAYRCGGYMAQPSTALLSVLKELKIPADMTVIKGLQMSNAILGDIHFEDAPSNLIPWLPHPDDVAKKGDRFDGVLCFPTYSFQIKLPLVFYSILKSPVSAPYVLRKYWVDRTRPHVPLYFRSQAGQSQPESQSTLNRVFNNRAIVLDFGALPHRVIESKIRSVLRSSEEGVNRLPLVLSTHAKSFFGIDNFKGLLRWLKDQTDITFVTTRMGVKNWLDDFAILRAGRW